MTIKIQETKDELMKRKAEKNRKHKNEAVLLIIFKLV